MIRSVVVLCTSPEADGAIRTLKSVSSRIPIELIRDKRQFAESQSSIAGPILLLSYDNGIVVPGNVISALNYPCYNFHPAPPEYPGRDPYHFACYEGAVRYGATAHIMESRIDSGSIVDVEYFEVGPRATPADLLATARLKMLDILRRLAPKLLRGEFPSSLDVAWGPRKTTRRDFLAMCEVTPDMSREEFNRRFHAFDGGAYDNLYLNLHGKRFRIDKRTM